MASRPAASEKQKFRHRIKEIKLNPKTSAYDTVVELYVDGVKMHTLPRIEKGEMLQWNDLLVPCDVYEGATIMIQITEIHMFRADRVDRASYTALLNAGDELISIKCENGMFDVQVELVRKDAAEQAYSEALVKVQQMKKQQGVVEKAGKVGDAFKALLALGDVMVDLDPTGGAKVAFAVCTKAWVHLEAQANQDARLDELIESLAGAVPSIESIRGIADSDLKETVSAMLNLVEDAAVFILGFRPRSPLKRAINAYSSDAQAQTNSIISRFKRLRMEFDTRLNIQALRAAEAERRRSRLKELRPVDLAGYDTDRQCLIGTRVDIIDHLVNWSQTGDNGPRVAWVHGLAGLGKSSIAASVCKRLDDRGVLASSFFCKRDNPELRDPRRLLMTIVCGLAQRWNEYAVAVVEVIRNDIELQSKHIQPLYDALVGMPLRSLDGTKRPTKAFVVLVDALDECGDITTRRQLLVCLISLSRSIHQLKIVVTSRPDEDIKAYFINTGTGSYVGFDMLHYSAKADIRLYVQAQLNEVIAIAGCPEDTIDQVTARADGLFIWARTACTYIIDGLDRRERLKAVLSGTHLADIDMLYMTVLLGKGNVIATDDNAYTRKCLGAIVVTAMYSPLSVDNLAKLIGKYVSQHVLEGVVNRLSSVLYKDVSLGGAVRISHPSFMDFITTPSRSKQLCVDLELQNQLVAECCLRTMTTWLRFNICELETSDSLNQDVPDLQARVSDAIAPHLSYSCLYWSNHLAPAPPGSLDSTLRSFLCGQELMYWLEALSLLGKLSIAPSSLLRVMQWCSSNETQDCRMIANDAYRFVLAFYDPISSSTPHLYISTLAFAPVNSHISRRMRNAFPNVLVVTEGGDTEWTRCIRSISVGGPSYSVAVSPNGQRVASGCEDSTVRVWDAETGEVVFAALEGHSNGVGCITFSHDGCRIISGSDDNTLLMWDTPTGEAVVGPLRGHSNRVTSVACSPDGCLIASGSYDFTVRIWSAGTGDSIREPLRGHQGHVDSVKFSPDSCYIVSGSEDHTVRLWEAKTGDVVLDLMHVDTAWIASVGLSPDGQQVVSVSSDGTVRRWHSHTGMEMTGFSLGGSSSLTSAEFSPDGSHIVASSIDGTVCIWSASTGEPILEPLAGHSKVTYSAVFSSNGDRIVSGSADQTIRIWDANLNSNPRPSAEPYAPQQGHSDTAKSVAFSSNGRFILSGSDDRTVRVWDAETGHSVLGPLEGHSDSILSVSFSPDDSLIASSSQDTTTRIWDAKSGQLVFEPLQGHLAGVRAVVFSPDGHILATGSGDKTVRVWCVQTGSSIMDPFTGHSAEVRSVAFSPDSRRVVSGSEDMTLRIWDAEKADTVLGPLTGHTTGVLAVVFSPDGKRLLSGSKDGELRIWDAQTGHVQLVFPSQSGYVLCVSLSYDGRRVVSGSADGEIRIFDIETGNMVLTPLQGHSFWVLSVAISPDNRRIASGSYDNTVRIWNAEPYLNLNNLESWILPGTQVQFLPQATGRETRLVTNGALSFCLSSDSSGWVTTTEGKPLLWLPHELRVKADRAMICISKWPERRHVIDFNRFVHGNKWTSVIGS